MRVRLFKKHPHGGWSYHSTQMLGVDVRVPTLQEHLEDLEEGDLVYTLDWYMIFRGNSWETKLPTDEFHGLLRDAVEAERKEAMRAETSRAKKPWREMRVQVKMPSFGLKP